MPELSQDALSHYTTELIASVIERLRVPFLLLDGAGRVTFANQLSVDILADGRYVGCGGDGRLEARHPEAAMALQRFLDALNDDPTEIDCQFEAPDGGPPLLVTLSPYGAPLLAGFAAPRPIAVVFFREGYDGIQMISNRFGLTRAETDVVRAIVNGQTVSTYAAERGLSVHTARKQLNGAMQKAGISRQNQLAQLIQGLNARDPAGLNAS